MSAATALSFNSLHHSIAVWRETLEELQLALHNDRPRGDDPALVGQLDDDVTEALAHLERCARLLHPGALPPPPPVSERLARFHRQLTVTITFFATRLASPEHHRHLAALSVRRGRDWAGWSQVVQNALLAWPAAAAATHDALTDAWLDASATPVPSPFPTTSQRN